MPSTPTSHALASYLLPETHGIDDRGFLTIGGVPVDDLADEFGTPLFVYDEAHLRNRCREAVQAFPDGVSYASKAFGCSAMARIAAEVGMGIDVVTCGEMYYALRAGVDPKRIVFHGNNKSERDIEFALRIGVGKFVVDSIEEIDRIESVVKTNHARSADVFAAMVGLSDVTFGEIPQAVRCLLRVNAGIEAHTHEYVMTGQTDSKFGISLETGAARAGAKRIVDSDVLNLVGVHGHIGSIIFETEPFEKEVKAFAPFVEEFGLGELSIGGGLGVPYVNGEPTMSILQWGETVRRAAREAGIPPSVRITAEPGRSIVAAAAITLYRVGVIKEISGIRTYVAVDGGMTDNPRPILYGSGYEAFLPRSPFAARDMVATVVGKHCESGDIVVQDGHVPSDIAVGDLLATPVSGAYGHSMASNYNGMTRPAVVFVGDGNARTVIRREMLRDLVAREM